MAYSTMPEHKAHELEGQGGIWINILAEKLKTTDASVLDVLTAVNVTLSSDFHSDTGVYQQPELDSMCRDGIRMPSLNGKVQNSQMQQL